MPLRWPQLWLGVWIAGMVAGAYLSLRAGIVREPVIPHLDKLIHACGYGVLAILALVIDPDESTATRSRLFVGVTLPNAV